MVTIAAEEIQKLTSLLIEDVNATRVYDACQCIVAAGKCGAARGITGLVNFWGRLVLCFQP